MTLTGSHGNGVGNPAFKGFRIMRSDLVQSLTDCIRELDNVKLEYGRRAVQVVEFDREVVLHLNDGTTLPQTCFSAVMAYTPLSEPVSSTQREDQSTPT